MSEVTIEGTGSPCTMLGTGETTTVEHTPFIDGLVRNGFVRIIGTHSSQGTTVHTVQQPENFESSFEPSTKAEWIDYADSVGVAVSSSDTKQQIIDAVNNG